MNQTAPRRLIVAMTGATGTIYGVRVLELLHERGIETHLILSRWGGRTLLHETNYSLEDVRRLATFVHSINDQGAPLSSGSFVTDGMIIAPCSMRTLGAIANGLADDLIHRAADVVLKERRKLVLAVRESPLNDIHLENMLKLSRMGAVICPPMPSFYTRPSTVEELVHYSAVRLLDQFGIHLDEATRWDGKMTAGPRNAGDDNGDE
jgi:4-hydroxy-3-polyprenylbenzoate decarboxylase